MFTNKEYPIQDISMRPMQSGEVPARNFYETDEEILNSLVESHQ